MHSALAGARADRVAPSAGLKPSQDTTPGNAPIADAASAVPAMAGRLTDDPLPAVQHGTVDKPRIGHQLGAGVASWYGGGFHGRRTASGEKFDRHALTAAHKTLPLGTRVVVRSPRNGRQIVVRINDRGPYGGNRIIDLSEAAAGALGLKARGHDWVVINAVLPPSVTPVFHAAADTVTASPQNAPVAANAAPLTAAQVPAPSHSPAPISAAPIGHTTVEPLPHLAITDNPSTVTGPMPISIQ